MEYLVWGNVAPAERWLRASIGLITIFTLLMVPVNSVFFAYSYLLSLYVLLTALIEWDPLYAVFYKLTRALDKRFGNEDHLTQTDHYFAM